MSPSSGSKHLCVIIPPTADEVTRYAPRNRMTPAQFAACVSMHYYFVVMAFADPVTDVVVVKADGCDMSPAADRLGRQGFRVMRARDVGNAAADPRTKVFAWCHTPMLQRCPVAARLDLSNVLACPRIELG